MSGAGGCDPTRDRRRLRILHLFANYKWTGPADPAIRAAAALRAIGADVVFAQAERKTGDIHYLGDQARRRQVPVIAGLQLPKHHSWRSAWRDGAVLARRLRRGDFDLVHAHLIGDHVPAALARRLAGRPTVLVRSVYEPEAPARSLRNRLTFAGTDGVVVPTAACEAQVVRRFGFDPARVLVQEPTTDVRRFARIAGDLRAVWGVAATDFLIGITARVQPHRRFPFLWQVARRVVDREPRARFVLLGRGNERDVRTLVHEPVAALGLDGHVVLPGYLVEPDYSRALASLDLFTFLVPGSDGTCRAVREAMAAGLPVVTTKRGILPELVGRRFAGLAQDPCGQLIEDDVELMAAAMLRLIRDPAARERLRQAALARVAQLMDEELAGRRLWEFYCRLQDRRLGSVHGAAGGRPGGRPC
jgi:glycosyltransferase involved in cell wall biosynthesis